MSQPKRPDPDELLKAAAEGSPARGRLKIYLGMAAGVGKTFAMLSDANVQKKRGIDVVAGYIELHGRKETEELLQQLEQLPGLTVTISGSAVRELDLDLALKRKPALLLVDELAHTNAAELRHRKRWQDIDELLRAGINVATTVNVQHVESLSDVVAQITGIIVQETVPDAFFARADDIEVIDLPPTELIERLQEGKVYPPERVNTALQNFFKEGNLIALRELMLRQTAERVDAQMQSYRLRNAVTDIWHTTNRIMVCIGPSPTAIPLVRAAVRLAESMQAKLLAVSLESLQFMLRPESDRALATKALQFAESLGAETIVRPSQDMVEDILSIASEHNVTGIVLGKSVRPRWKDLFTRSFVDELLRRSSSMNIHVMSLWPGRPKTAPLPPKEQREQTHVLPALGTVAATTAVCSLFRPGFELANLIMIYLLGVAWVAYRYSRLEAIVSSIAAVAAFDFCFVPPRMTFAVSDVRFLMTFAVMLVISLMISSLTLRLKKQSSLILERERRIVSLYDLSRGFLSAKSIEEIGSVLQSGVQKILGYTAALVLPGPSGELQIHPFQDFFDPSESAVAAWSFQHQLPAGRTTDTLPGAAAFYLPIQNDRGGLGLLAFFGGVEKREGDSQILEAICNQTSLALRRVLLEQETQRIQIEAESERLRNTLLSSISHDLRTPLATIEGSASALASRTDLNAAARSELAGSILGQAGRLRSLVKNILDFTRIESGQLQIRAEWNSIEELLGSALSQISLDKHTVEVSCPSGLELVSVDGMLIQQVFQNLIENFIRHTPAGSHLKVQAGAGTQTVEVKFCDNGPGIRPEDKERIFQKLYRSETGAEGGFGLGLAICKAIMRAHGGDITVSSGEENSACFTCIFPRCSLQPEIPAEPPHEA